MNPIVFPHWKTAFLLLQFALSITAGAESVSTHDGRSLTVDPASGAYTIATTQPAWKIGGSVNGPLTNVRSTTTTDPIGPAQTIEFSWQDHGRRSGSIRLYDDRALVLFTVKYEDAVAGPPAPFPVLSKLPDHLMSFRYSEKEHLLPELFRMAGDDPAEQYGGPIMLFNDQADALIVSPASNFMIASLSADAEHGISSGFNSSLTGVPAGYEERTLLAIGPGIHSTWQAWGQGLIDLYGKKRPANDADTGLKYLGYWTDNGAYYYYNYDLNLGYAKTILAVRDYLKQHEIPIHYMQLDSWFYPKTFNSFEASSSNKPHSKDPNIPAGSWNRYGGMMEFTGAKELFPDGIEAFTRELNLPLIVHNRWIDPTSPYHTDYKISGVAAVDPKWWERLATDIVGWGVQTYEQDWNNWIYAKSPEMASTTWAGDAYLDGMASACAAHKLTLQYCMILPRMLLQGGAKYSNLTTVRLAGDRFERHKWRSFLYGSVMADALGVWPWTDVFKSGETPNILLATLSGGMVGISDRIGDEDATNIFRAVRKDGVIVKPDGPLVPIDATFISEGQSIGKKSNEPLIYATHSGDGSDSAYYVFACTRDADAKEVTPWALDLHQLGVNGSAVAFDYLKGTAERIESGASLNATLHGGDDFAYRILIPIGPSGMALIGDPGKFVTRGRQRIASCRDDGKALHVAVVLSAGEPSVKLSIYAQNQPRISASAGSVSELHWDSKTKIATVQFAEALGKLSAERTVQVTIEN